MKRFNKKALFPLLAVIIIALVSVSACQPTPEKPVVVNKADGKLEEAIQSTAGPAEQAVQTEAQSKWTESYTIPNLSCEINADIVLPDTNEFPVFKVKKRAFDAALVQRIAGYFTEDATGMRVSSPTKEELEQQLVLTKRGAYMLDDNGGRWEPYEGQEDEIKDLEEQIKNAQPETFGPVTEIDALPVRFTYEMPGGKRAYVDAYEDFIYVTDSNHEGIELESSVLEGEARPGEPEGTTVGEVSISEQGARAEAEAFISELGIGSYTASHMEKARLLDTYTFEITSRGWSITFSRSDGNSIPVDFDGVQTSGIVDVGEEDFVERWFPECIRIYIDETGIREFGWDNPVEITEVMNTNVALQDFEDIKDRIKNTIKFGLSQRINRGQVHGDHKMIVNKIVLASVLVPLKDDLDHQMFAPAWIVYYKDIPPDRFDDTYIFAVNAVDGSSIDLSMRSHMLPEGGN